MSISEYEFESQLKKGEEHEKVLDEYFGKWFTVQPISMAAQRFGIDRVWTMKMVPGYRYSVEYKADTTAANTGNVFIETVSVDTDNKPGWGYTSCAQLLIYYIPPLHIIYGTTLVTIKHYMPEWISKYKEMKIPNKTYKTHGLIIPICDFAKHCFMVQSLDKVTT